MLLLAQVCFFDIKKATPQTSYAGGQGGLKMDEQVFDQASLRMELLEETVLSLPTKRSVQRALRFVAGEARMTGSSNRLDSWIQIFDSFVEEGAWTSFSQETRAKLDWLYKEAKQAEIILSLRWE